MCPLVMLCVYSCMLCCTQFYLALLAVYFRSTYIAKVLHFLSL